MEAVFANIRAKNPTRPCVGHFLLSSVCQHKIFSKCKHFVSLCLLNNSNISPIAFFRLRSSNYNFVNPRSSDWFSNGRGRYQIWSNGMRLQAFNMNFTIQSHSQAMPIGHAIIRILARTITCNNIGQPTAYARPIALFSQSPTAEDPMLDNNRETFYWNSMKISSSKATEAAAAWRHPNASFIHSLSGVFLRVLDRRCFPRLRYALSTALKYTCKSFFHFASLLNTRTIFCPRLRLHGEFISWCSH